LTEEGAEERRRAKAKFNKRAATARYKKARPRAQKLLKKLTKRLDQRWVEWHTMDVLDPTDYIVKQPTTRPRDAKVVARQKALVKKYAPYG
jgi:hypothetical protein